MRKMQKAVEEAVEFTRLVRDIKFFAALNIALFEKVLACVMLYSFDKGEKICRQGEPGDSCYVVRRGRLSVEVKGGLGFFSKRVAELGPGDIFGEMALLGRHPRSATVACLEDTEAFVILADNFNAVISQNPAFRAEMKRLTAERNFELSSR
jgi:CRP/FNR family transcriptional regulator, cyclic AMP receptor protein